MRFKFINLLLAADQCAPVHADSAMDRDMDMNLANFDLHPDFSFSISDVESAQSQDERSKQPYEEEDVGESRPHG